MRLPAALQPLSTRDYRLAFSGAVLSNSGTWMQNVAVQWLVYQQTGSATWVGVATFAQFVPLFFAGPLGGVMADRVDRKRLLLAAQGWMMGWSVALAAITLGGIATPPLVVATVLALGFGFAFHGPTWQAVVPHLVPREQLTRAIALNSAQMSTARIAGPALGGVLIPLIGPGGVFAVNAASYVAVLTAIVLLRLPAREARTAESVRAQLAGGVRYALDQRVLAWLIAAVLVVSLLAAPMVALLPVYAEDVLGGDARTLGTLTAFLGAGSLIGSVALGQFGDRFRSSALVGGSLVALGVATVAVAAAPAVAPAGAALAATGVAILATGTFRLGTVAASNSRLQTHADDAYRGRVLSLFLLCFGGAFPVGALAVGAAADVVGAQAVTVVLGLGCVAAGLGIANRLARHDPAGAVTPAGAPEPAHAVR